MGSLMAGWASPYQDPKSVNYKRNKSLTKGEIDAYWKAKNEEEGGLIETPASLIKNKENISKEFEGSIHRANSLPLVDTKENKLYFGSKSFAEKRKESSQNTVSEADAEKFNKKSCWWTRSNWAFLNEPPVIAAEGPSYKYASQNKVTDFGSSEASDNSQTSTEGSSTPVGISTSMTTTNT